jgi:hypothetical protein
VAELASLHIADPPGRWEALGFDVRAGVCELGAVAVCLGADGTGITAWNVRGVAAGDIDGLASAEPGPEAQTATHPNGAIGIDHLVVITPDFDRTAAALEAADIPLRRVRDADGFRQGFRRLGPAILELVESKGDDASAPARFWGLVVIVNDLEALADRLGERLGTIRPAVQPGRSIATLRKSAGLSLAVAFMDPEP